MDVMDDMDDALDSLRLPSSIIRILKKFCNI